MIRFNSKIEQKWFDKLYTFEYYNIWLKRNGLISTYANLKAYKNWCFNWILDNVWDL